MNFLKIIKVSFYPSNRSLYLPLTPLLYPHPPPMLTPLSLEYSTGFLILPEKS